MHHPLYVQIFSITDHTQAFQNRYQGGYQGINAELQTSEFENGKLRVSKSSKVHAATIPENYFEKAKIILAYRHSDTGTLNGTSETIFSIHKMPWTDMPGLAFESVDKKDLILNLWSNQMKLKAGKTYRIHFGKTIVFLKNCGLVENMEFTNEILSTGPASLHSEIVDESLTIAPESGSGIQVKMGQETQN